MPTIPKIIHYCWFGNNEKPEYIKNYIESWKKFLPEYEIIEWNESNFNINLFEFSKEAYEHKKFAFVSDIARLHALYNYGGIYFDTDVEVIKSFNDLIENKKCIFGFEIENRIATSFMATYKNNPLFFDFLNIYRNKSFINNGNMNLTPNVVYLTTLLKDKGLKENGEFQKLEDDIYVYPKEYFSPYDYINCINEKNKYTYCIHHFAVSWLNKSAVIKRKIKIILVKLIGKQGMLKLRSFKRTVFKK